MHVDHVVSVADGGPTSPDNLIAACQRCNGGKGAKSLGQVPASEDLTERMEQRAATIRAQSDAIREAIASHAETRQSAINLKCAAYGVQSVNMPRGEIEHIVALCNQYGPEVVQDWYATASLNRVSEWSSIKYVYGIIRRLRKQGDIE